MAISAAALALALTDMPATSSIEAAATFNQGYATVSYLSSAIVDMDLHTQATPPTDIDAFAAQIEAALSMPTAERRRRMHALRGH